VITPATEVIPDNCLAATKATGSASSILFEADEAVDVTAANLLTSAFVYDAGGALYTDITTELNTDVLPVQLLPAVPAAQDALYIGHSDVLWDRMDFELISIAMADVGYSLEAYDGSWRDMNPDLVIDLGGTIRFNIASLCPSIATGLTVRVYYSQTDTYEDCTVAWDGTTSYITTTGTLGQVAVSLTESDYMVGAEWRPVIGLSPTDTTTNFTTDGYVSYGVMPKMQGFDWVKGTVNSVEAYWLRFRVTSVAGAPVPPTVDRVKITEGGQYIEVGATQGRTITDPSIIGTGLASQSVTSALPNVVDQSGSITVDGDTWTEVDNFLASSAIDKHFTTAINDDEYLVFTFGDGTNGKMPPSASSIIPAYRVDAQTDGNVGADSVVINRTGISLVSSVTNYLPASGWQEKQGHDLADIESMKIIGPASLRAMSVSAPIDIESKAVDWVDDTGSSPVIRAQVIEEGYGLKTVQVLLVGAGGAVLSSTVRDALELYYNDPDTGIMLANHEAYVDNYTQNTIAITVQVTGITAGLSYQVQNQLAAYLLPTAVDDDGNWVWDFGGTVAHSRLEAETYKANAAITNVTVTNPAADVVLAATELPIAGAITVVIV
jgi:hypothetical protein